MVQAHLIILFKTRFSINSWTHNIIKSGVPTTRMTLKKISNTNIMNFSTCQKMDQESEKCTKKYHGIGSLSGDLCHNHKMPS